MVDISIYVNLTHIDRKVILKYIKDNMDYLDTKGLTYEFLMTCNEDYRYLIDIENVIYIPQKDLNKTAQGTFIAVFDERYCYPDYRLHFQWRSITVFNKTKKISTNSFIACYDTVHKKTYIKYDCTCKEALFYRRNYIQNLEDPINSYKDVCMDNEICLVVDECLSQPVGSRYFCDGFIEMEIMPNFINAG